MGHVHLGELPRTRRWVEVVEIIRENGDVERVAAATMKAAEHGLTRAQNDPALTHATWLLTQLPLAAKAPDYLERLRSVGLPLKTAPSVLELVGAFSSAVDAHVRGKRTDLGEMAEMAGAETLSSVLGARSQSLFGTTPEDVRRELGALSTSGQFGAFTREFFGRLTTRYLGFFLSKELPNHVGAKERFHSYADRAKFDDALDLHCRQAARIVQAFAGGWFSKANFEGGITPEKAQGFVRVALKKIRAELRRGGEPR